MRQAGFPDEAISERVGFWHRRLAVRFALDNTRLEGGSVSPEARRRMDDWAEGKLSDDELMSGFSEPNSNIVAA